MAMGRQRETRECIGGPHDGADVLYVGPEVKVPLPRTSKVQRVSDELPLPEDQRMGLYIELTPLQEGARHYGVPVYVWQGEKL